MCVTLLETFSPQSKYEQPWPELKWGIGLWEEVGGAVGGLAGTVSPGGALKALPTNSPASKVCPHNLQGLGLEDNSHELFPISGCEQGDAV